MTARFGETLSRRCKTHATESTPAVANFRRSQRYPFQLDVLVKGSYRNTPTTTEDVSFHGVFLRSDEERAPNQLIKFIVVDPRNGEHVELLGIVARQVPRGEATALKPPGVGVSLFGNDRGTEARWVAIMRQIKMWVELGHRAPPPVRVSATPTPAHGLGIQQSTLVGIPRPGVASPTPLPSVPASRAVSRSVVIAPPPPSGPPIAQAPPGAALGTTPFSGPSGNTGVSGVSAVRSLPNMPGFPSAGAPPTTGQHSTLPPPPPPAGPMGRTETTPPPLPHGIDATKRAHERRPARFNVTLRPEGIAALQQFEMKDISEGGTFVLTGSLVPLGSKVNLRLVHPQTGDTFQIAGHVARAVDSLEDSEKGIGIRFETASVDREAWAAFVGRLVPRHREAPPVVEAVPGVRVLRGPPDPPILLGAGERPVLDAALNDTPDPGPGLPPVILDGREHPVPVLLGQGLVPPRPQS